jgi:hypothetical protein
MSRIAPPTGTATMSRVECPTAWMMSVIVPASASSSAIVSGMRSPSSPTRTITNCPGRLARAMRAALTTMRWARRDLLPPDPRT